MSALRHGDARHLSEVWLVATEGQDLPIPGEIYRHFRGKFYLVLSVSTHTETGEHLVTYRRIGRIQAGSQLFSFWVRAVLLPDEDWTRPLESWLTRAHAKRGFPPLRLVPRFRLWVQQKPLEAYLGSNL